MAQDLVLTASRAWTLLTDADATVVTFQNLSPYPMQFKATADTTSPTSDIDGLVYQPGFGESSGDITALFPGVTTPVRLWAKGADNNSKVYVSHA